MLMIASIQTLYSSRIKQNQNFSQPDIINMEIGQLIAVAIIIDLRGWLLQKLVTDESVSINCRKGIHLFWHILLYFICNIRTLELIHFVCKIKLNCFRNEMDIFVIILFKIWIIFQLYTNKKILLCIVWVLFYSFSNLLMSW